MNIYDFSRYPYLKPIMDAIKEGKRVCFRVVKKHAVLIPEFANDCVITIEEVQKKNTLTGKSANFIIIDDKIDDKDDDDTL